MFPAGPSSPGHARSIAGFFRLGPWGVKSTLAYLSHPALNCFVYTSEQICQTSERGVVVFFRHLNVVRRNLKFLPFLIKVHELGHIIGNVDRTHSAGWVRLSVQKYTNKEQRGKPKHSSVSSTHMKCVLTSSSVAVLGRDVTNKVFLACKH